MSGAVVLSTRMAVLALVCWEVPIKIPGFQKAFPCQNSSPFVEVVALCLSKWCSWIRSICGGLWREDSHALISFCLAESFPNPLTLRETIVRGRSDIRLGV